MEPRPALEPSDEHRRYLGLAPVDPRWQRRVVSSKLYPDVAVYHFEGRILKYVRFREDPVQLHYHEVDVDLLTGDGAKTWSKPGGRGKPKKVVQSSLPRGSRCELVCNAYPRAGVASLECRHVPSGRVVVASGDIEYRAPDDIGRWLERAMARAGAAHARRLDALQGARRRPPEPWRPGDVVAIEVAESSWVFARLLVPVEHLAELGLFADHDDPCRPVHIWRCEAWPTWWSTILALPTTEPSPSIDALQAARRLQGGFLFQPSEDDGRHRVVAHAPVTPDELDFPDSLQRQGGAGRMVHGYDWGLVHLEIPEGTALDQVPLPPVLDHRHLRRYDLPWVERQLRGEDGPPATVTRGRWDERHPPEPWTRAMVLEALGLPADLDYDGLCARQGVPDRAGLAALLNAVPAPGIVPGVRGGV
jgi:hypothetical protein